MPRVQGSDTVRKIRKALVDHGGQASADTVGGLRKVLRLVDNVAGSEFAAVVRGLRNTDMEFREIPGEGVVLSLVN